jgi:hypothetical protein
MIVTVGRDTSANRLGQMRTRPLALLVACLTASPLARAAEPAASVAPGAAVETPATHRPGFGDRFFRGTSAGALPPQKALVIGTLYVGSLTSIGFGIVSLLRAGSHSEDAEAFKLSRQAGFCADLASGPCARYRTFLSDERSSRTTGMALLGVGGLLALSGALTAELWQNDASAPRVALAFDRSGVFFGTSASF